MRNRVSRCCRGRQSGDVDSFPMKPGGLPAYKGGVVPAGPRRATSAEGGLRLRGPRPVEVLGAFYPRKR